MPMILALIPLLACTADILPGHLREANAAQQTWIHQKTENIAKVAAETIKGVK